MKFLVPNYSCLQNPWLRGYRPQIPVLSVLCPQLNLLNPSRKKFLGTPLHIVPRCRSRSTYPQQQDTICCKYLSLTLLIMGKILPQTLFPTIGGGGCPNPQHPLNSDMDGPTAHHYNTNAAVPHHTGCHMVFINSRTFRRVYSDWLDERRSTDSIPAKMPT